MVVREHKSPMANPTHLRGNELETRVLPPCLLVNNVLNLWVHLGEWGIEDFILNSIMCLLVGYSREMEVSGGCAGQVPGRG